MFPFLKSSTLIFLSDSDVRFPNCFAFTLDCFKTGLAFECKKLGPEPGVPGVLGLGFGFGLIISFGFAESRAESRCGGTGGRGLQ